MFSILIPILILTGIIVGTTSIITRNKKQEENKFFSITLITKKLLHLTKRFPNSVLFIIGLAVLSIISIYNKYDFTIDSRIWFFFIGSTFISTTITLFTEDFLNYLKTNIISFLAVLIWGVYSIAFPEKSSEIDIGKWIELFIINATFFLSMFFISFLGNKKDNAFWNFTLQMLWQIALACILGVIFFGGLSLAFFAIDSLFNISIDSKIYSYLAVICFILLSPIYFLSTIPYKKEKYNNTIFYNKIQRILAIYVFMPIMAIYAIILYAYLFKIIIAWELPNGWVSWLVSALASGGLLVIILLYPIREYENNKLVNFTSRWMILLILPLLTLMSVGIFRRINDYGITINRGYILLLNIWFYGIYIYLFLTKSRHIKWILISPVFIAFIASINLWGISNFTKKTLTREINVVLTKKVSIKEAKNIFNQLDQTERKRMESVFVYLNRNFGKKSIQLFFTDTVSNSIWNLLSDLDLNFNKNAKQKYINYYLNDNKIFKTNNFNYFMEINFYDYENTKDDDIVKYSIKNDTIKISTNNNTFSIPIKKMALEYLNKNKELEFIIKKNNYKIIINDFRGTYFSEKDSIHISSLNGYLFYN